MKDNVKNMILSLSYRSKLKLKVIKKFNLKNRDFDTK